MYFFYVVFIGDPLINSRVNVKLNGKGIDKVRNEIRICLLEEGFVFNREVVLLV